MSGSLVSVVYPFSTRSRGCQQIPLKFIVIWAACVTVDSGQGFEHPI